jgi:tetratricopeptide (TPR) repeat protein
VPAAFVCGSVEPAGRKAGLTVSLADAGARGDDAMKRAGYWLRKASSLAVKRLLLASLLLGVAPLARAADDLAAIDQLYLHRDQGKNLDQSTARLEALLKEKPDDAPAMWRLGRCYFRQAERLSGKKERIAGFEKAEDTIKKSVELDPKDPEAHFWYGVAMGKRGQTRGIMSSLGMIGPLKKEMKTVLELDPKHGGAHHVLGELYRSLPGFYGGSKKKALAEFEQAVELSPDYAVNYVALAEAYADKGDKDKARATLKRLFELKHPSDPAEYPDNVFDGKELEKKLDR